MDFEKLKELVSGMEAKITSDLFGSACPHTQTMCKAMAKIGT